MEKKKNGLLKRFLPYYKKYGWIVAVDLLFAALTTLCEIVLPLLVKEITNKAMNDVAALTIDFILRIGIFYIVLRIIDTGANYFMISIGHIMGAKIETDMRRDLFAHLEKQSHSFYDNTKVGSLMSRMTTDLFEVTEFAHHCPEEFFIAGIKIIASFIILIRANVILTLITFAIIPLMIITMVRFRRTIKKNFADSKKQIANINSQIEDSLLGIRVTKAFAKEDLENEKHNRDNCQYLKLKTERYYSMGRFHSTTRLLDGIMYIVVVLVGGIFLVNGDITAPDYVAYLLYVSTLLTSVRRIIEFTEQFETGMSGIDRFIEIMDTEPEIVDKDGAVNLDEVKGQIEFKNVSFSYEAEKGEVITNLDLNIKSGESVALVGPSGGGKTTLCALIPRFYEATSGEILIDGLNIKDVTLKSLRENIGVVAQDVYLFSGTIKENIAYGKDNATDEEIIASAKLAGAHEFIEALPNGYDTYVGERGVKLSGGQKQRVSIARVFLKNPPILILDEATSALDNESERLVQKSLEELSKGRTTITIAHRLTTIKNADRILVLTENGIEESGTHKELIEKDGIYAELYKLYATI